MQFIIFFMFVLFSSSCENEAIQARGGETATKASLVKIYDNEDFDRVFQPIDIQKFKDGFVVMGRSKIGLPENQKDGALYLLRIDQDGQVLWERIYEAYSYMANNMLINDDRLIVFCHEGTVPFVLTIDDTGEVINKKELQTLNNTRCVMETDEGFLLLRVDYEAKMTYLSQLNTDYELIEELIKQNDFDIGIDNAGELLAYLDKYLLLDKITNGYLYYAPLNDKMSLISSQGDTLYDGNDLLAAVTELPDTHFSLVIRPGNNSEAPLYFVPGIDLKTEELAINGKMAHPIPYSSANTLQLFELNNERKVFIQRLNTTAFVAGTTIATEGFFYTFDDNGIQHRKEHLGHYYPYIIERVIKVDNESVVLTGSARLANQFTRIFVIVIPQTELEYY